jgi:hypothetical protein
MEIEQNELVDLIQDCVTILSNPRYNSLKAGQRIGNTPLKEVIEDLESNILDAKQTLEYIIGKLK